MSVYFILPLHKTKHILKVLQTHFELNPELYWEPLKLLDAGRDVLGGGGSTDDMGSCILSHLKLMEGVMFETKGKSITLVQQRL